MGSTSPVWPYRGVAPERALARAGGEARADPVCNILDATRRINTRPRHIPEAPAQLRRHNRRASIRRIAHPPGRSRTKNGFGCFQPDAVKRNTGRRRDPRDLGALTR